MNVVNLMHVIGLEKYTIYLDDGKEVPENSTQYK